MTNEKITTKISGLGTVMSGLVKARGYEQIINQLPRDEWFRLKDFRDKILYIEYVPERHDINNGFKVIPRHTTMATASLHKLAFTLDILMQLGYVEHRTRKVTEKVKVKVTHPPITNDQPYRIDVYDREGNFVGRIRNPKAEFNTDTWNVREEEVSVRTVEIDEYRITGC